MKPCSETLRHVNDYLTNVVRGEKGLQFTSLTHGLCQINISSFKHLTKKQGERKNVTFTKQRVRDRIDKKYHVPCTLSILNFVHHSLVPLV